MEFLVVVILAVAVLAAVFFSYFIIGEFSLSPSVTNTDWGAFGSYFGGVAGSALSFISVILVAYTLYLQRKQIGEIQKENIKQDNLRYIEKIDDELSMLLSENLKANNAEIFSFGDIVNGCISEEKIDFVQYKSLMDKLLKLTASYCQAISVYKDNVNSYFIYRVYWEKANELLNYLESKREFLYEMSGPTLLLCRNILDES